MDDKSRQEIPAEIERALREALEPFLHVGLLPGGMLHENDRALIHYYIGDAIKNVLENRVPQQAFMTLQTIKDATTKKNFGDAERNWLISECERLMGRCRALREALAPFANMGSWGMVPGDRVTKLDRDCARAERVLYGEEWRPQGTDKGRMAESNRASEEV